MLLKKIYYVLFFIQLSVFSNHSVAADDELLYIVKKNDTIWDICKTYVQDPLCWQKLAQFNQLKNPKYLPPSSTIRIPKSWLIDQATTALVVAVEGSVLVVRQNSDAEDVLIVGDLLNQQDIIKSKNGSATIEFADNSRLLLKSDSIIRMSSLQYYDVTQLVSTRVELLKGRVKAQVEKLNNRSSRYEISTPAAVAAVRGTDFRVERKEGDSSDLVEMRTELLTGELLVSSDISQQNLVGGQGVLAIEGESISKPIDLLARPLMVLNETKVVTLPLTLKWKEIKKAVFYKVTLMTLDAQVWEKTIQMPELIIDNIEFGQYQILIRGVDAQGFEGRNRRVNLDFAEPTI